MKQIRSDLAVEICEDLFRHNSSPEGIEWKRTRCGRMILEEVQITNQTGERLSGKPRGKYITLGTGKLWMDDREIFKEKVFAFREILSPLFQDISPKANSILVAGLGNRNITSDAIGPAAVKSLVVTRHIRKETPLIFEDLGLFDLCAMTPGVLGQTGIESADIIGSVVEKIRPGALVVIDALASRNLERLVTTVQISDSGICPGSGIGNSRPALTPSALGIPVISIGVPTVVDAATLASDAIRSFSGTETDEEKIRKIWSKNDLNFFVTPRETDQVIQFMGAFIGYGINLALNRHLSYEDMLSLIGG